MARFRVTTTDQIPVGGRQIVTIAGRSIGIFNVDGHFYAVRNRCPHQGGPLCDGHVVGHVESEGPGRYDYNTSFRLLECPWHGWEFDLATGQSWCDPERTRVKQYPVIVEQGALPSPEAPAASVLTPGPYVVESYPVEVDSRSYLVVEVKD